MNYYNEIKNELVNNEINRKVKSYSINKINLNTYYNVGIQFWLKIAISMIYFRESITKINFGRYWKLFRRIRNRVYFYKSESPIKLGNRYNYIDLLLYIIKYRCYVVVELKVTELKKEHMDQIMTYMNYIDKNVKTIEENSTVGITICKQDNGYVIKYCSDDRIIAREYELVWYNRYIESDHYGKNTWNKFV